MLQEDLRSELAEQREAEAKRRYATGEKPMFSTGICGSLTCGYGNIDSTGYWEFPLYHAKDYLMSKGSNDEHWF